MPKMHISKSILIEAAQDKVHSIISDFNQWRPWSPWLISEPEAKVDVEPDGKYYEWTGKRVGAGNMRITAETNAEIACDLMFLKPWKSKAKCNFYLEEKDGKTEVTWTMDSSLPFFMFFMKKMMMRLIGMDYERGLLMLKDYCETGKVNVSLEFMGESKREACKYVGIKNDSSIDGMPKVMEADFGKLMDFASNNQELVSDEWFSIYHKFAFGKNQASFTSAIKLNGEPVEANLPEGLFIGSVPETKVYTIRHKGTYKLIGNAWSAITAMQRAKEFKCNKGIHPMEIYRNSPKEVSPEELISDISMPIV